MFCFSFGLPQLLEIHIGLKENRISHEIFVISSLGYYIIDLSFPHHVSLSQTVVLHWLSKRSFCLQTLNVSLITGWIVSVCLCDIIFRMWPIASCVTAIITCLAIIKYSFCLYLIDYLFFIVIIFDKHDDEGDDEDNLIICIAFIIIIIIIIVVFITILLCSIILPINIILNVNRDREPISW